MPTPSLYHALYCTRILFSKQDAYLFKFNYSHDFIKINRLVLMIFHRCDGRSHAAKIVRQVGKDALRPGQATNAGKQHNNAEGKKSRRHCIVRVPTARKL